ncbi:MAG: M13-type metalloendopeptidase [Bacteroidota bacterium]
MGYPDKWRDYSNVQVKRDTYFENRLSANMNDYNYSLAKVGQPVDRTEWYTTPPTVTAYNNPPLNEIVFPAGILQSPYFDLYADDALNYGGIGMVIGHEITHSFDDQGAQFDKEGNVEELVDQIRLREVQSENTTGDRSIQSFYSSRFDARKRCVDGRREHGRHRWCCHCL